MKIRILHGRAKVNGEYLAEGDVVNVDDDAGADLVARGVAVQVRRATRVALNIHMDADDQKENEDGR